eukprot:s2156_g8.t1
MLAARQQPIAMVGKDSQPSLLSTYRFCVITRTTVTQSVPTNLSMAADVPELVKHTWGDFFGSSCTFCKSRLEWVSVALNATRGESCILISESLRFCVH